MKTVTLGQGRAVHTPWHDVNEAAAYCGWGRDHFVTVAERHQAPAGGGEGKNRRYHCSVLDLLLVVEGGLVQRPEGWRADAEFSGVAELYK